MGRRKKLRKRAQKQQEEAAARRKRILDLKERLAAGFEDLPISGVEGFDPAELAALKGRAIEGTSRRFTDIGSRLKTALSRRGVLGPSSAPSGDFARTLLRLETAKESERAGGLRDIAFRDVALRRQREQANRQARISAAGIFGGETGVLAGLEQGGLDVQRQLALTPTFTEQAGGALFGAGLSAGVSRIPRP